MLERITDLPSGIDGVKAVGKVSRTDFEKVIEAEIQTFAYDGLDDAIGWARGARK